MMRITFSLLALLFAANITMAQTAEPPMTVERMGKIIRSLDENAQSNGTSFQINIQDVPALILTDTKNDRMRILVPIRAAEGMTPSEVLRVLQANFDTTLDARYAIARGKLWATFIHPLSFLEKNEFISGLGQTVNIAKTYGTLYSGGALSFGGGDSIPLQRKLIDDLLKKGIDI